MRTIKKESKGYWITDDELTAVFVIETDETKAKGKSNKVKIAKDKLKAIHAKI